MGTARLRARLAVLRTFGAWGRVEAETVRHEPVVSVDGDRLVLRRHDGMFWPAGTCPHCGGTLARVDLPDHARRCAVRRTWATSGDGVGRRRAPSDTVASGNRSSSRVFGFNPPTSLADLVVFAVALLGSVIVALVVLGGWPH